VYITVSEM